MFLSDEALFELTGKWHADARIAVLRKNRIRHIVVDGKPKVMKEWIEGKDVRPAEINWEAVE